MASVSIHPPKTPVTKGSLSTAKNTVPNVCKMPGPPAPFVPTPLPNIGKSMLSPKGYSTTVKVEGNAVAIRGASFGSIGDIASKATGGGLLSMNTHGPTKFIGPGSLTVKIQGKGVHLLGEPMLNNCGPSGSPPNAATLTGVDHSSSNVEGKEDRCSELKAKFGIHLASHKENTSGSSKRTKASSAPGQSQQSHHIFQDAALKGLVPRAAALAIMLADSFKNTEHGDITSEQNSRRYNKTRGGEVPGKTFGEIKKQARDDLAKGLEGKRNDGDGKPMTKKEAEDAADCIVAEAEEVAKEEYKKKTRKKLTDATPVKQPGECLAAGTTVQMANGQLQRVETLQRGDRIRTSEGPLEIVRIDLCRSTLIDLEFGADSVLLAPYHRLFDPDGHPVRADVLRAGAAVATAAGIARVTAVRSVPEPAVIYRLGLPRAANCLIGTARVMTELPYGGPAVTRQENVSVLSLPPHEPQALG